MKHMYIDECKGSNGSFYMLVHIYGEEVDIKAYENDIKTINQNNSNLLGTNFNGIHAVDIKEKSKQKKGRLVELWLDKFEDYINQGKLDCFIAVQSAQKKQNNSDYLVDIARNFFCNKAAQNMFPGLKQIDDQSQRDILACVHQIWFLGNRCDKINATSLVVHPDQIGKIIEDMDCNSWKAYIIRNNNKMKWREYFRYLRRYILFLLGKIKNKNNPQTYLIDYGKALSFQGTINTLLNTFLHPIRVHFGQKKKIRIDDFKPLQDQNSFIVQMCDILGNYTYNSIIAKKRNPSKNATYKLGVLEKRFGIKQNLDDLSKNFTLNDRNELECQNSTYVMCIDLH